MMLVFAAAIMSVGLNGVAQLFLKRGISIFPNEITDVSLEDFFSLDLFLGFFCYGLSIGLWLYVLKNAEVSVAYPTLAVGLVFTSLISIIVFQETVSLTKVAGLAFILVGVVFIWKAS